MASSLPDLVDNFAEGIHKTKWKYRHNNKKREKREIKYKDCECSLNTEKIKMFL